MNFHAFQDEFLSVIGALSDLEEDNYYWKKHGWQQACTVEETCTAKYIAKNIPTDTLICEIGCGLGQLAMLIAAMGYKVIGVDGDFARIDRLKRVMGAMTPRFPAIKENFTVVHGIYPSSYLPPQDAVLVFGNVVNTGWANTVKEYGPLGVLQGHRTLMDFRIWGEVRAKEQMAELEHEFSLGATVLHVGFTVHDVVPR